MNKLKIYFYSPGFSENRPLVELHDRKTIFINPTPLYLDSYCKTHCPEIYDKFEWTKMQYLPMTQQELVNEIENLEIDILALSVYTWNQTNIEYVVKNIRALIQKPITILIGGPSVNVVRDSNYLQNLPDVDYAIYAQGEKPFVSLIKHLLKIEKISVLNSKNIAWLDKGKLKKADYEFIKIKSGSPIVESKHLLEQIVANPDLTNYVLHFPYETSRGCPYTCAFCDWTSGLSHKVSKRKFLYEQELETLGELGIVNLYMADANFGLFPEDIEIAKTMARLKRERKFNFIIYGNNFSKTKKDQVFEIAEIFLESGITPYLKLSVQDIDDNVLDNIDRPDIPWSKHVEYITKLRQKFPGCIIALDIIKGLPGQTRASWENIYSEICKHNLQLDVYDWEIIANSPAGYDKDYQVKMQLKTMIRFDQSKNQIQEDVISTISYDEKDYAYFSVLFGIYNRYFRDNNQAYPYFIKYIKESKELNYTLDLIVENLADKNQIKHIINNFMIKIVKENLNILTKEFIKFVVDVNLKNQPILVEKNFKTTKLAFESVFKDSYDTVN